MSVTPEQKAMAAASLKAALANPDKANPADIDTWSATLEEWKSQGAGRPQHQVLTKEVPSSSIPNPDKEALDARVQPLLAQHAKLSGIPDTGIELGDTDTGMADKKAMEEQAQAASFDPKLPSESGHIASYRPPEHRPPRRLDGDPRGSVMEFVPSVIGGGTDHVMEAGLAQAKRDLAPVIGQDAADKLREDSPIVAMYRDQQWAKVYDQAKAEGRAVVRVAHGGSDHWIDRAGRGTIQGMAHGAAGAYGVLQGMTGGLAPVTANARALMDASPGAALAGEVVGTLSPLSIGAKAATATMRGLGAAKTALGTIGRFGASGAAAGAAQTGAGIVGEYIHTGVMPDASNLERNAARLALGTGLGAAGGVAVGGVVAGAKAGVRNLEEVLPQLAEVRPVGGETDWWSGFRRGPQLQAVYDKARALNPGAPNPGELVAESMVEPMRQAGLVYQGERNALIAADMAAYGKTPAGQATQQVTPITDRSLELLRQGTRADYEDVAMAGISPTNQHMRAALRESADARLVTRANEGEVMAAQSRVAEAEAKLAAAQAAHAEAQANAPTVPPAGEVTPPTMLPVVPPRVPPPAMEAQWAAEKARLRAVPPGMTHTMQPTIAAVPPSNDVLISQKGEDALLAGIRADNTRAASLHNSFIESGALSRAPVEPPPGVPLEADTAAALSEAEARRLAALRGADETRARASYSQHPDLESMRAQGRTDVRPVTVQQARNLGYNIEELVAAQHPGISRQQAKAVAAELMADPATEVVLIPKAETAAGLEASIGAIDTAAKAGSKTGADIAYAPMMEAARATRGRFAPEGPAALDKLGAPRLVETSGVGGAGRGRAVQGYEAMRARHADLEAETQRTLHQAGLPDTVPHRLTADQQTGAQRALGRYHSGDATRSDRSLETLAERAGVAPDLKLISASNAADYLSRAAAPLPRLNLSGNIYGSVPGQALRMRLDPSLRALSTLTPNVGALGATGARLGLGGTAPPSQMHPDEARAIQQLQEQHRRLNLRKRRELTP